MSEGLVIHLTVAATEEVLRELCLVAERCSVGNLPESVKTLFVQATGSSDVADVCRLNVLLSRLCVELGFDVRPVFESSRERFRCAVASLATQVATGQLSPECIDEQFIDQLLPEVDLAVVPGSVTSIEAGASRSFSAHSEVGFETGYAEFFVYEGDFSTSVFEAALESYADRDRRRGGVTKVTKSLKARIMKGEKPVSS